MSPSPFLPVRAAASLAALVCALLFAVALPGCGSDAETHLTEAKALQDAGDFRGSIEELREVVRRDPDHAEANYLLGVAYVTTGQPSLAVWPLRKAMESDEYRVPAGILLASTLLQTRSLDEAVRVANEVLEVDPTNVNALLTRARASFEAGHAEQALADAEAALAVDPESFPALELRGAALTRLERNEEAVEAYRALAERAEKSGDPNAAVRGCIAYARALATARGPEAADPEFRRCIEIAPDNPLTIRLVSEFYDETGRPEEGNALWRQAMEKAPDELRWRIGLAERLVAQGKGEEAQALLQETAETFDTPEAWYRLASLRRRMGDTAGARDAIERALELMPQPGPQELRFMLVDLLVELGELERARELAQTLEDEAYRGLALGSVLLAEGKPAAARRAFEKGLAQWPNNPGARMRAGQAAEALGRYDDAIAQYREAVRADKTSSDAALALAQLYLKLGQYDNAIGFARMHVQNRPFVGPNPWIVAARANAALGRFDEARTLLSQLAEKPGQETIATIERANIERMAEGPAAALAVIEKSGIDLTDPANEAALRSVVQDLLALGRTDEALRRVQAAAKAHPETPVFADLEGRVLLEMGRVDEAEQAFQHALALQEDYAPAVAGLGAVAAARGDLAAAVEHFDRAAELDPAAAEPAYRAAQVQLARGELDDARKRLEEVLKRDPGHAGAANDLAWLLAEDGQDLDRALRLAERATSLQRSASTLDTLGWVRLKRGEVPEAVEAFEKAVELDPKFAVARYHLGLALEQAGDHARAIREIEQALATGPFPEAASARETLARLQGAGGAQ